MTHKQILDKIANDDTINERYFILARSSYIENGEQKTALALSIPDPTHYIRYLYGEESTANVNIYPYDEVDAMFEHNSIYQEMKNNYNPDNQFLLYIETCDDANNNWSCSFAIINKKSPRTILYSKSISLSGSEFNQEEHVISTPCVICGETDKTKLDNLPYNFSKCSCCNEYVMIKEMYECTTCCTQYIYS